MAARSSISLPCRRLVCAVGVSGGAVRALLAGGAWAMLVTCVCCLVCESVRAGLLVRCLVCCGAQMLGISG